MRHFVSWKVVPVAATFVAVVLAASDVHAGPAPAEACAIAKNKAAVKKVAARAKCWQKAIASGQAAASPECLSAAETKFVAAIAKAESKGGCLATGEAGAIGGAADACIDGIIEVTPPSTTTSTTTTTGEPTTTTTLELTLWYQDSDGDFTGNPAVSQYAATQPPGYVPSFIPADCDDNDPLRYPNRPERCDLVADSDCNPATPDCPAGCYAYQRPGGNVYMFCTTPRDYNYASDVCHGIAGGHRPVIISDADENEFVYANATYYFGSGAYWFWIGGRENAGTWKWPDGSAFWPENGSYTNWAPGEPANFTNAQQMSSTSTSWRGVLTVNAAAAPFVCELY